MKVDCLFLPPPSATKHFLCLCSSCSPLPARMSHDTRIEWLVDKLFLQVKKKERRKKSTVAIIHSIPGWAENDSRSPWQGDKETTPLLFLRSCLPTSSKSCGGARLMKSELSHKSISHFHLGSGDRDTNTGSLDILRSTPRRPSFSPERRAAAVKITFTSRPVTPPQMESLAASHYALSVDGSFRALRGTQGISLISNSLISPDQLP